MTPNCIIVSPYFPPSTLAGVHRARHLAKHLPASGWTPVVVAVHEAFYEERLDWGLAALVPSSVEVVKVPALPSKYCRPVGLGDISLRAWRRLRAAVMKLLATRDEGAVLITGSPYYPMLMAAEIKKRFGVPVVLDFQDPWVSAWGAQQPRWSKAGISHQLAKWLEPKAVRGADFITSVSAAQNAEMGVRYPWLDRYRMAAIPIGGDPEDYEALRSTPPANTGFTMELGRFNLSYVGTIWPPVLDTLRTILRAAALVRARYPEIYARLRLNFIGTTANPKDPRGHWVRPLAEAEGVADIVRECPQRLPYLEAQSVQVNSDGILIIGSDEPHYTASKIYGVLMSGRPYLSVFHHFSSAHELLQQAGGGIALSFVGKGGLPAIEGSIAEGIVTLASAAHLFKRVDPIAYAPYTAVSIAKQYAAIFDRLHGKRNLVA